MRSRAVFVRRGWTACLVAALAPAIAGCGSPRFLGALLPNQRPTVAISQAPPVRSDPSTYLCEISWTGLDPDGRIVGFRYALDPPAAALADTPWVDTQANRKVFSFSADSADGAGGRRLHTFVVVAVDDAGARSVPAHFSFDATTIAPTLLILSPPPSALLSRRTSPAFRITWSGFDADGRDARLPAQYRWRLFNDSSTPQMDAVRTNPDTLRSLYAPRFADWDSLGGGATSLVLRDLNPGQRYLFAIVAIDEAGAWSPVLSLYENLLQFTVEAASTSGPRVTFYTDLLTYEFASGGIVLEAETWPRADFAAGSPVVVRWDAVSPGGAAVRAARWAVDIASVDDETPRANEDTDVHHWSRWSVGRTIAIPNLDPPPGPGWASYRFYLEVEDETGQLTLVGMHLTVVRPAFARDLLVVDDTFMRVDRLGSGGCVLPPAQVWPTAAELDTFLFAVGNAPWKCYPAGTTSSPGLFAGYDFDTLGTHVLHPYDFSLSLLGRYRNILWMVDGESAVENEQIFNTTVEPMPMLRHLSTPGVPNPLVVWMQQGGRLWLMGGGAAYASLRDFSLLGHPNNVFSSTNGELSPGRFMSSHAHWRSEATTYRSAQARRSARAVGGWPGAPDYSALPATLLPKSASTDPLPPLRTAGQFYSSLFYSEYLTRPNTILERVPGSFPDSFASALDTLYETVGGQSGTGYPIMTVYHGTEKSQVVFSGFPLWYFRRAQGIELTDFVLQRLWGMTRRPVPR